VALWGHTGGTTARVRGSRVKSLGLNDLWCKRSHYCLFVRFLQRVFSANRVLLPGQLAGLVQSRAASPLRARLDAGGPLPFGEGVAVFPGGGTEPGSGAQLRGCARVVGMDVRPPTLFAGAHPPDPIAAVAALEGAIKTFP
jgi:hypothetical protein